MSAPVYAAADYAGRTVDLLLLKTVLDAPVYGKRVGMDVETDPMVVSGVEKLVQRYVVAFVNAAGSTMFRPSHGTDIVGSVVSGRVYNAATLQAAASEANMLAYTQIRSADAGLDTPADERLASAEVTGAEFSRGTASVKISVKLTTEAGSSYVYVIPVGVGVH